MLKSQTQTNATLLVPTAPQQHSSADQAEAAFLLVSAKRFPRTTGQVIHVDGGLADGFLR